MFKTLPKNVKIISIVALVLMGMFLVPLLKMGFALLPIIGIFIGALGWLLVIAVIVSLTGLQKKLFKSGGLIQSHQINIPFIGKATVESTAGREIVLKIQRQQQ